jgi:hypothetical protein
MYEGKEQAEDANRAATWSSFRSDQLLGNNNIGDGPFDLLFHARPAAWNREHPNRGGYEKL